jgi:hypothetical protein
MKEGDMNAYFFHKQTKVRRSRNTIKIIYLESKNNVEEYTEVKEASKQHFEDTYTIEEEEYREESREMLEYIPSLITSEDNTILLQKIKKEEIAHAMLSLEWDKSLGSDGFLIHFFRNF